MLADITKPALALTEWEFWTSLLVDVACLQGDFMLNETICGLRGVLPTSGNLILRVLLYKQSAWKQAASNFAFTGGATNLP